MLIEHNMGRDYVKGMVEAVANYKSGDQKAREKFAQDSRNYIDLLTQHIDKEENILYMMADMHLSEEQEEKLLEEFEKIEQKRIGPGKHEEYHKLIHHLDKNTQRFQLGSEVKKVEIFALTEDNLRDVPEWNSHPFSCKYCIYWEFPEECVDPTKERKADIIRKKLGWLKNTNKEFGNCGKLIYVDGKAVGYAQFAQPRFLPNSNNYQTKPRNSHKCCRSLKKSNRTRLWS